MNGWLLERFDGLRRELAAAGTTKEFCDELRELVSPDGALSLYEAIDASSPAQWRQVRERAEPRGGEQLPLASKASFSPDSGARSV